MSTHDEGLGAAAAKLAGLLNRVGSLRGDVRVEFPIYTPEDAKWCVTAICTAARTLAALHAEAASFKARRPDFVLVLLARAASVDLDRQLKLRTSRAAIRAVDMDAPLRGPRRDPATDEKATPQEFAWRLRRMGYSGNLRVDFPLATIEDVAFVAEIMGNASRDALELYKARKLRPLERVLRARAIVVEIEAAIRMRREGFEIAEAKRA